jgi:hypothetical protein
MRSSLTCKAEDLSLHATHLLVPFQSEDTLSKQNNNMICYNMNTRIYGYNRS